MPELPELEIFKRYAKSTSLHQKIKKLAIFDEKLLGNIDSNKLTNAVEGEQFEEAKRYGKYLLFHLSNADWLILHFGMSGELNYYEKSGEKPEYTKLLFIFENDTHLAYINIRRLGEINYSKTIDDFVEEKNLGPDFLQLSKEEFIEIVKNRRGSIKYTLMQQNIIAGIGNEYSDEVLFQIKIHPKVKANNLAEEQYDQLYEKLNEIIDIAIQRDTDSMNFPDNFLLPHREKGGKCPICGETVKRIKVSGRSAYICPNRQQKHG